MDLKDEAQPQPQPAFGAGASLSRRELARNALLSEVPERLGASWVRVLCEGLRLEGRAIDGGWPGTVPEARSRVRQYLDGELERRGLALLRRDELELVTARTYERARLAWLERANAGRARRRKVRSKQTGESA